MLLAELLKFHGQGVQSMKRFPPEFAIRRDVGLKAGDTFRVLDDFLGKTGDHELDDGIGLTMTLNACYCVHVVRASVARLTSSLSAWSAAGLAPF